MCDLHDENLLQENVNVMLQIAIELLKVWEVMVNNQIQGFRAMDQKFWRQNEILEKVMVSIGVMAVTEKYTWEELGGEGSRLENGVIMELEERMEFQRRPENNDEVQEEMKVVAEDPKFREVETLKEILN
ncbi:hypothetical protein BU17DRAFT_69438 [Hysterangium stoloniferum]|nr:hypothetical protein BU17DRAFT_69438 [Hysterangium stoloniferum]